MSTAIDHASKLLATLPTGSTYRGRLGSSQFYFIFSGLDDDGAAIRKAQEQMHADIAKHYGADHTSTAASNYARNSVGWLAEFYVECGGLEMSIPVVEPGVAFQAYVECDGDVGASLSQALDNRQASVELLEALVAWGTP